MGEMTRAQYVVAVRKAAGNRSASHPVFSGDELLSAINGAPNRIIKERPDLFQEHHGRTWTLGPLEAGSNRIDHDDNDLYPPPNLLELHKVTCNADEDDPSVDPGSWSGVTERPVSIPTGDGPYIIGLQNKTTDDYPILICRKDSDLLYWPTTSADTPCWLRLYGTSKELPLTDDDAQFQMSADYDMAIVYRAAAKILSLIPGNEARALELLEMSREELGSFAGSIVREAAGKRITIKHAGALG